MKYAARLGNYFTSFLGDTITTGSKEDLERATTVIAVATTTAVMDPPTQSSDDLSSTVEKLTEVVVDSGATSITAMTTAATEGLSNENGDKVDAKAVASLFTPEGRSELKRLANEAWNKVHEKGVAVNKAISELFTGIATWFKELGTRISQSVSNFFETLSKKVDSYRISRSFDELKNRGMAEESVVTYNVAKKSKEDRTYDETHEKKTAVGAELREKAETIGAKLKHVETRDRGKLMQDIRGAKGKPQGKGRE